MPVTFEFDNKGEVIPGSFVEVYLLSSQLENVISVPRTALTEEQGIFFVYLQLDEEGYKKQEVTLGADNGKSVQILTGIKPGDRVVTEGAYQVRLASASNASLPTVMSTSGKVPHPSSLAAHTELIYSHASLSPARHCSKVNREEPNLINEISC